MPCARFMATALQGGRRLETGGSHVRLRSQEGQMEQCGVTSRGSHRATHHSSAGASVLRRHPGMENKMKCCPLARERPGGGASSSPLDWVRFALAQADVGLCLDDCKNQLAGLALRYPL